MKKNNHVSGVKASLLKGFVKAAEMVAEPPLGGEWPWCTGIIHQPKHPRVMEAEKRVQSQK